MKFSSALLAPLALLATAVPTSMLGNRTCQFRCIIMLILSRNPSTGNRATRTWTTGNRIDARFCTSSEIVQNRNRSRVPAFNSEARHKTSSILVRTLSDSSVERKSAMKSIEYRRLSSARVVHQEAWKHCISRPRRNCLQHHWRGSPEGHYHSYGKCVGRVR